jgi:hypothetical protein
MKMISSLPRPSLLGLLAVLAIGAPSAPAAYKSEVITVPELPDGDILYLSQISPDGQLILLSALNGSTFATDAGYVYNRTTQKVTTLPSDPDAAPGSVTYAGINDFGWIAGTELSITGTVPVWAATQGWQPYEAFVFDPTQGGVYHYYNAGRTINPADFINCQANSINDLGQIAGVYENGGGEQGYILANIRAENVKKFYQTIDVLPQGKINMSDTFDGFTGGRSQPQAINNLGQVVGYYTDAKNAATIGDQGFLYDPFKGFTTLNVPGNIDNQAFAINDLGVIVGATYNPAGTTDGDGFIYSHGKYTIYDYPGASLTQLYGVSDTGVIVGEFQDPDGSYGAFLLTPN